MLGYDRGAAHFPQPVLLVSWWTATTCLQAEACWLLSNTSEPLKTQTSPFVLRDDLNYIHITLSLHPNVFVSISAKVLNNSTWVTSLWHFEAERMNRSVSSRKQIRHLILIRPRCWWVTQLNRNSGRGCEWCSHIDASTCSVMACSLLVSSTSWHLFAMFRSSSGYRVSLCRGATSRSRSSSLRHCSFLSHHWGEKKRGQRNAVKRCENNHLKHVTHVGSTRGHSSLAGLTRS